MNGSLSVQNRAQSNRPLLAILMLVLLAGMAFRITLIEQTQLDTDLRADAVQYFLYSFNLSNSGTYSDSADYYQDKKTVSPDGKRPPLFPILASLWIDKGTTEEIHAALYLNLWLQCVGLLLFSLLLCRLWNHYLALIPITLIWFNPHIANTVVYFLTESLFLALLVISLYFINAFEHEKNRLFLIISGLFIGLAAITRGTMEYYWVFFLLMCLLYGFKDWKKWLSFALPCLLPVVIWKIRNYLMVPDEDNVRIIATLYHGSFPDFMYKNKPETYAYPYKADPMQNYAMASLGNTLALIWHRFVEEPAAYLAWYGFGKLQAFWQWSTVQGANEIFIYPAVRSPYYNSGLFSLTASISYYVHYPMVILGLMGTCFAQFKLFKKQLSVFSVYGFSSLLVLYACLLHIIAAPFPRYSIPFKPMLMVMACYCAITIINLAISKLKKPQTR